MEEEQTRCSFCKKGEDSVRFVIEGPEVYICDDCIKQYIDILKAKGIDLIQETLGGQPEAHRIVHPLITKDERIHCTFCKKSQDDVEAVIAGPEVYICDECVDLCVDILEERGSNIIEKRIDRESESATNLIRKVTLPPEYYQAGLSLLGYFGVLLRQKFPSGRFETYLELEGFTVQMVVNFKGDQKEEIQKFLADYGLTIQGRMTPIQLLGDALQAEALKERLSHTNQELRRIIEIKHVAENQSGQAAHSIDDKVSRLCDVLGWIFRREIEDIEELFDLD